MQIVSIVATQHEECDSYPSAKQDGRANDMDRFDDKIYVHANILDEIDGHKDLEMTSIQV